MFLRSFYNTYIILIQNQTRTIPKYCPSNQNYASVSCLKIDIIHLNKIVENVIQQYIRNQELFTSNYKNDLILKIY